MSHHASDEYLFGAKAIASALDIDERAAAHLLRKGLPGAKKIHGKWIFCVAVFRKSFEQGVAA